MSDVTGRLEPMTQPEFPPEQQQRFVRELCDLQHFTAGEPMIQSERGRHVDRVKDLTLIGIMA